MEQRLKTPQKVVAREEACSSSGGEGSAKRKKEDKTSLKKEETEVLDEKKGLYANIHAKRKRGGTPAKPGSKNFIPAETHSRSLLRLLRKKQYRLNSMVLSMSLKQRRLSKKAA